MTRLPADSTSQNFFQLWLGMERPQKNTFFDVIPRELVDPVLRPLCTTSTDRQKSGRWARCSIILKVRDRVRGEGGPPRVGFDGFQSILNAEMSLRKSGF